MTYGSLFTGIGGFDLGFGVGVPTPMAIMGEAFAPRGVPARY